MRDPGRSPPTPLLSLQATSRASHRSSPFLSRIMKNPPQELPTSKRHTPSYHQRRCALSGVGGLRFIPCTQGHCLLQVGKQRAFTSAFVQVIRATNSPELDEITMNIPHFNISTVKKRCLKLTFVYFTLRTAREHLHMVSTQAKFSEQFSSVYHLLL